MVSNNVSRSQYSPSYPREITQTERVQPQNRTQETAEARRADFKENKPQAKLSTLGGNFDVYA